MLACGRKRKAYGAEMGSHTGVLVTQHQPAQAGTRPPHTWPPQRWLSTESSSSGCRIFENLIPDFLNPVSTAGIALRAHVPLCEV